MRFRDDNRGVTIQIGAVLFFATVIIALSLYQATVVPSQNADVEYKHSQEVQGQLASVRNSILEAATTGKSQTASVDLGVQYPSRVFLMNPPPAAGTLRTDSFENGTIRVSNVEATEPETRDFINGTWTASTKRLTYEPGYHELDGAPNLVYGESILYNHYPAENASIPLTDQVLVRGDTITLVSLAGSLSTSRASAVSVNAEALSAPYNQVQVTAANSSEPVNISIPTQLSAATLRNQTSLGSQANVTVVDGGQNRVVIQLRGNGTYTLQTAKVGVSNDATVPSVHYLTVVEFGSGTVTVEARDRFNNPVSGVKVTAGSDFKTPSKLTKEHGRVTFELANEAEGTVTLEILDGTEARERVRLNADDVRKGDTVPPETTSISVSSKTVPQGSTFKLSGTVSDRKRGGTQIVAAYWNRTDPSGTDHSAKPMQAADGNFDQVVEDVQDIDIDTSGWAQGNHTLRLWGVDAAGNDRFYREITVKVVQSSSQSTVRGVVFKDPNGLLSIYDYRDGSVHTTNQNTGKVVGGVGDWDGDTNDTDIGYLNSNDRVRVYDNSTETTSLVPTSSQGPLSFFGDFDGDGDHDDIAYKDSGNSTLKVGTYNETEDSVEQYTVRRASTGSKIMGLGKKPGHITGAQDIDSDGNPEFAYVKNKDLYVAEVVDADSSNIYVVVESTPTDSTDVLAVGDFADLDDDGIEDDVPIVLNNDKSKIRYYDYSRDKNFLFASLGTDVGSLGGSLDTDDDGKQTVFFVSDGTLHYSEVGSRTVVDTGIQVKETVGGAN